MRWVAPVLLAVVFAFAGGAKLADRAATAEGFRALRLPAPDRLALQVPAAELATAVLLVAAPAGGASVALLLLVAFSVLLVLRLREGSTPPCRCFGGTRVKPIAWIDLARNAVLAALAVVTLVLQPGG
ncbi:MAG TPA: MauE/DoxX family redox-associated membrane protein [Acidimicrobiales bacterium]|nr:MauE/DoxX family redox-associated membrane protein [Acidimicrobiales bacterium]